MRRLPLPPRLLTHRLLKKSDLKQEGNLPAEMRDGRITQDKRNRSGASSEHFRLPSVPNETLAKELAAETYHCVARGFLNSSLPVRENLRLRLSQLAQRGRPAEGLMKVRGRY